MTSAEYSILLFYKFVPVEHHAHEAAVHLALCKRLGVLGRVLIAPEGINGTISGTHSQCDAYIQEMNQHPLFGSISYKRDTHESIPFHRISVKPKDELVTFRQGDVSPLSGVTGTYLSPQEFYQKLQSPDVIVVDGRTDYEYDVGHFDGALRPSIDSFREFPRWIEEHLSEAKNKTIITYCTGGIRCEKLTSFMIQQGFTDVHQLHGGIVEYGKDPSVRGDGWKGVCYVFDERITVPINHTESRCIVGTCFHCGSPAERYINCASPTCHRQHLVCDPCDERMAGWCSEECS
jgi:UPF0176 protein